MGRLGIAGAVAVLMASSLCAADYSRIVHCDGLTVTEYTADADVVLLVKRYEIRQANEPPIVLWSEQSIRSAKGPDEWAIVDVKTGRVWLLRPHKVNQRQEDMSVLRGKVPGSTRS